MKSFTGWVSLRVDAKGNINTDEGAEVRVLFTGTNNEAPIFEDEAGFSPITQPIKTNIFNSSVESNPGRFTFFAPDGDYDIKINENKGTANTTTIPAVEIKRKDSFKLTLSKMIASKTLKLGDVVIVTDRDDARGDVVTGEASTGRSIINLTGTGFQWKLIDDGNVMASHLGLPTGSDDTAGFVELNAFTKQFKLQAGTYLIDNFTPLANTTVKTDGFDTIIQQNSGILTDTRIILIENNGVTIEDIQLKGNISTDTGEQRHGITIRSLSQNVENINIGNLKGVNLRGDVLNMFGNSSFNPNGVNFGDITANNCIRTGFSMTAGNNVTGGYITALDVGLFVFDIEPDTNGGIVGKVNLKGGKGRQCGILGDFAASIVKDINIESIDLDGSLGRSTPPLGVFSNDKNGLIGRNTRGVRIGSLTIKNQLAEALVGEFSGSDVPCGMWYINQIVLNNNNTDASSTDIININAWDDIEIGRIENISTNPLTELLIIGESTGNKTTNIKLGSVKTDCRLARFVSIDCGYSEISYTANSYCVQNLYRGSTFHNATWDVGRIAGLNTGEITFISSNLTFTGSFKYDSSVGISWNAIEINTKVTDLTPTTTWTAIMVNNVAQISP